MTGFQILFDIAIEHDYFVDGVCKSMQILPSPECDMLIRASGLLLRPVSGGIKVLADTKRLPALRHCIADYSGRLALDFHVRAADRYFDEYTEPPPRPGHVLYFDSRQVARVEAGRHMLHEAARVSDANFQPSEAPAALPRPPVALIRIVLTGAEDGIGADRSLPAARRFGIHFGASAAHWKYYLLGPLAVRPVFITDLDEAVAFTERRLVDLPGAGLAGVFMSHAPVALRDVPGQRFQLRERASFGDKVLMKRLPNARVGHRQRELVDGQAVLVAEIFLNQ